MRTLTEKEKKSLNAASLQVLNEGLFGFKAPSKIENPESNPLIGLYNKFVGPRTSAAREEQQARDQAETESQRVSGVKQMQHDTAIKNLSDKVFNPSHPEYHLGNSAVVRGHLQNAASDPDNAEMHHAQALAAAGLPNPLHEARGAGAGNVIINAAALKSLIGQKEGQKETPKGIIGSMGSAIKQKSLETLTKPLMVPTLGVISSISNAQLRRANMANFLKGIGAVE